MADLENIETMQPENTKDTLQSEEMVQEEPIQIIKYSILKGLKISTTGFDPKIKAAYQQYIEKLGGKFMDSLRLDTNLIISFNVLSEKYRGGCLLGIPIVSTKWLEDTFTKKQIQDYSNYKLPIFKGVSLGVLGFQKQEIDELDQIVSARGGEVCSSLMQIQSGKKDFHVILIKSTEIKQYDSFLLNLNKPAVTIEWLKNCLSANQYLKPTKYSVNVIPNLGRQNSQQKTNEEINQLKNVENHLNKAINDYEIYDSKWNYLEDCVISFFNLPNKMEEILKRFIDVGGGFFVNEILPETTHIIVSEYTEIDLKILNRYQESKIVNSSWLKDCLLYSRMVKEDDYLAQPVPNVDRPGTSNSLRESFSFGGIGASSNSARLALSRRNTLQGVSSFGSLQNEEQSSQEFRHSFANSQGPPSMSRQSSGMIGLSRQSSGIGGFQSSTSHMPVKRSSTATFDCIKEKANEDKKQDYSKVTGSRQKGKPRKIVSIKGKPSLGANSINAEDEKRKQGYLFKQLTFYLDPHLSSSQISMYKKLVQDNSGRVLDQLNMFEEIYHILPDSLESVNVVRKNKFKNLRHLSFRWIDYCLKNQIIVKNLEQKQLAHLYPFPHKMPLEDFKGKYIYCSGFPAYDKTILKEIIELLGGRFSYNPEKLNFLLCDDQNSKKYAEIKEKFPNVAIVKREWLFECVTQGKLANYDRFIL